MTRPIHEILQRPVVSEKSYGAMSAGKYVFRCHPHVGKVEIKRAVEEAFADQNVTVLAVNTITMRGKIRSRSRGRRRIIGHSPAWKKAIVTLAPGQKIEGLFEGV